MDIEDLLTEHAERIVAEASRETSAIERYRRDGAVPTRRRVEALHHELTEAVRERDVTRLVAYLKGVAHERAEAGFALADLEAAISALEDAIWHDALDRLPAYDLEFGHGLVATALAHGRAALRTEIDPAAPAPAAPSPDLSPLFRGASPCAARPAARPAGRQAAASRPATSRVAPGACR